MDISVETARLRRMRPLPDSLALKWLCPGTRAIILPFLVRRRRLVKDLLVFICKPRLCAVGPLCPKRKEKQEVLLAARAGGGGAAGGWARGAARRGTAP